MEKYSVVKEVLAKKMTVREYHAYRGWGPAGIECDGYLIEDPELIKNHPNHEFGLDWMAAKKFKSTHTPWVQHSWRKKC